ncbi:MAG TPA: gluconokinase [Ohtaekwangia sp.]|uniref:gluconokinase n=1 Tax=Ohtaekwangia sp. TaxID=2066019 RepID=UPI002F94C880
MTYILGIDIGTGSTKAVAVNYSGKAIHTEQVAYPTLTPQPGYSEQAPELIWQAFLKCILRTISFMQQPPQGIALSSAMHSFIPVNETGEPLMNMITWADNRSAAIAERIKNSPQGELLYKQTGTPVHAMSPLCKIIWMREHNETLYNAVSKYISIKEYIWFRLFGVYEIDHSIASATGLFDIESLTWNTTALSLCGISEDKLSIPVSTNFQRAALSESIVQQTGLPTNTPFFIGASDGCCANVGSFAVDDGIAALTIGTSGAIRVANTTPTFNFGAMTFNYRLDENTFISGGPINNGGVALKWYMLNFLKKDLTSSVDYEEVIQGIDMIKAGSEGLIFLPYILGERAPLWNSETCGVFFGITARHTQAHFTRAVLEGISLALYNISQCLEESGLAIHQVNVSGGFVHSERWLQLLADIFGKPIGLLSSDDASAIGAAYIALKKLESLADYSSLKPASVRIFTPNPANHAVYKESIFPVYRNLTSTLLLNMSILSEMQATTLL